MNVFNRVLAIVVLVILVVILVVAMLQPEGLLNAASLGVSGLQAFQRANPYLYDIVAFAMVLLAILVLALEVRRSRRLTVKVQQTSGSIVELTTESVARGLEYHVAQVPGIAKVLPKVVSTGRAVRVRLDLETDPTIDIAAKSEEIIQLTREVIEGKLGLKLANVGVSIRQAPYSAGAMPNLRREVKGEPPAQGPTPSTPTPGVQP